MLVTLLHCTARRSPHLPALRRELPRTKEFINYLVNCRKCTIRELREDHGWSRIPQWIKNSDFARALLYTFSAILKLIYVRYLPIMVRFRARIIELQFEIAVPMVYYTYRRTAHSVPSRTRTFKCDFKETSRESIYLFNIPELTKGCAERSLSKSWDLWEDDKKSVITSMIYRKERRFRSLESNGSNATRQEIKKSLRVWLLARATFIRVLACIDVCDAQ